MRSSFAKTLIDSVTLLRELPHQRERLRKTYTRLRRFKKEHSSVQVDLLIDQPPGSPCIDYDILVNHPDGGTVAVSWRPDQGIPWSIEYSDHWAANYVLTVNNRNLTVQQALLFLQFSSKECPDLMSELIQQQLVLEAIEEDPFPVYKAELQSAADEFRIANGLLTTEETQQYLVELGLSVERFQEILAWGIQARKLEARVIGNEDESYFEAYKQDFASIQIFWVETRTQSVAAQLAKTAQQKGLLSATLTIITSAKSKEISCSITNHRMCELPSILANASVGTVVGPVKEGSRYWVAEVLNKQPAKLDTDTRAIIRGRLFHKWLTDKMITANLHWHWI